MTCSNVNPGMPRVRERGAAARRMVPREKSISWGFGCAPQLCTRRIYIYSPRSENLLRERV